MPAPASGSCTVTPAVTLGPNDVLDNAVANEGFQPVVQVDQNAITDREISPKAFNKTIGGQTTVLDRNGPTPGIYQSSDYVQGVFTDGVGTVGSTAFTSATAVFTPTDNGRLVVGSGIPAGTTITYVNGNTVTLSQAYAQKFSDGVITGTTALQSATAAFTVADNGRTITGDGIAAGTTLTYVDPTHATLSQAATNAAGVNFQISGRPINNLTFTVVGRGKGFRAVVDANGNGSLEIYVGQFAGTFAVGQMQVNSDGSLSIGVAPTSLQIDRNGNLTIGSGVNTIGLTSNGQLFAGAPDYADAIVTIDQNGNLTVGNIGTVNHNIAIDAVNPALQPVIASPTGGAIVNPTNLSLNSLTKYSNIYYRTFGVDGVTNSDTSFVSATGNFTVKDVGKPIVGAGIPANAFIKSVTNSTTVVLSAATTAIATGVQWYLIPNDTDTLYVNGTPIILTGTVVVAARARRNGDYSALGQWLFTVSASIAINPVFNPVAGTYGGGTLPVQLSTQTVGAVIFYTTDGTPPAHDGGLNPTGTSKKINAALGNIAPALGIGTTTIRALAAKAGLTDSGSVPAVYTVTKGSAGGGGGGGAGGGGGGLQP